MQALNALSRTSHGNHWLAKSRRPRMLHVFDSVCNLMNEHRQVLSIVTPEIGDGPFNLVIKENVSFTEHLSFQTSVSISSNKIMIGDLTIHVTDANLWDPRPDWECLHNHRDKITNQLLRLSVTTDQSRLPQSLVSSLSLALANGDLSSALKVTSQLAGLGVGLTPSGDDFLMGAIYAAWIIHPLAIASTLAQEITNTAAPLTTSLSAAWLRSAGRGEAGILWHQFFETLVGRIDNPTYLQEAVDKILSVGETSGADALAGFCSTLRSILPQRNL